MQLDHILFTQILGPQLPTAIEIFGTHVHLQHYNFDKLALSKYNILRHISFVSFLSPYFYVLCFFLFLFIYLFIFHIFIFYLSHSIQFVAISYNSNLDVKLNPRFLSFLTRRPDLILQFTSLLLHCYNLSCYFRVTTFIFSLSIFLFIIQKKCQCRTHSNYIFIVTSLFFCDTRT